MPRNRRRFTSRAVDVNGVLSTLPQELASVLFQVADQIDAFHVEGRANDSRITSEPSMACSATGRLASRARDTASLRFSRASSRVFPCVFAPWQFLNDLHIAFRHRHKHCGEVQWLHLDQTKSAALIGSILTRFFIAAYTAFTTAGTIEGVLASPIPPGFSWLGTMWTSTTGISSMRMGS
jgi:hypothetical protein